MTAIFANPNFSDLNPENELHVYQVEVVNFDGDSETVYVDAYSPEEAQSIAAGMVENADYCMVQGCCA